MSEASTTYHYYDSSNIRIRMLDHYDELLAGMAGKVVKVTQEVIKDGLGVTDVTERSDKNIIWMLETSDSIRHPFATYAGALDWVMRNIAHDVIMVSDDANSSNPDGLRAFRNRRRYYQPNITISEQLLLG